MVDNLLNEPGVKPCPFCGGREFIFQYGTEDREGTPVHVMCDRCAAGGPWIYINVKNEEAFKDVIHEWNTREATIK